jgi:hypothetical protein
LLDPVVDAIHQLEADRPLLCQLLSVWRKLLKHAEEFERQQPTRATNVAATFKRRHLIHSDDAHYAAFLLDPINFSQNNLGTWMPPFDDLDDAEIERAHACLKMLAGPDGEDACNELSSLEAVGVKARTLPELTKRITDENGKVQVASIEARVNFWASSAAATAFPKLAAVTPTAFLTLNADLAHVAGAVLRRVCPVLHPAKVLLLSCYATAADVAQGRLTGLQAQVVLVPEGPLRNAWGLSLTT